MIELGSKKRLPFEEKKGKNKEIAGNDSIFMHMRKWSLNSRASLLLVCLLVSFLLMFKINGGFTRSFVFIPVLLLFWRLTFAHFEKPSLLPLNLLINILMVCPIFVLPVVGVGINQIVLYLPLVIGLTLLSLMTEDGRVYFRKADFVTEILIPLLFSMVFATISYFVVSILCEYLYFSLMLIVAVLLICLVSFVLSNFYSKTVLVLSDNIKLSASENYIKSRCVVAVVDILIFAFFSVSKYLFNHYELKLPEVIPFLIGAVILVLAFAILKSIRSQEFILEMLIQLMIMLIVNNVFGLVIAIVVDFAIVAFLIAYEGHKIYTTKSKYVEGLPIILLLISLVSLLIELI